MAIDKIEIGKPFFLLIWSNLYLTYIVCGLKFKTV